jgi:hypothetical protein
VIGRSQHATPQRSMFWKGSYVPGAPLMTQKQSRPAETRFIICSASTPQYKQRL